jgi:hypothetical protein
MKRGPEPSVVAYRYEEVILIKASELPNALLPEDLREDEMVVEEIKKKKKEKKKV